MNSQCSDRRQPPAIDMFDRFSFLKSLYYLVRWQVFDMFNQRLSNHIMSNKWCTITHWLLALVGDTWIRLSISSLVIKISADRDESFIQHLFPKRSPNDIMSLRVSESFHPTFGFYFRLSFLQWHMFNKTMQFPNTKSCNPSKTREKQVCYVLSLELFPSRVSSSFWQWNISLKE